MAQLDYVNCQGKTLVVQPTQLDLRVRLAGLHRELAEARVGNGREVVGGNHDVVGREDGQVGVGRRMALGRYALAL